MDKNNEPLLDQSGERIEASLTFTPSESKGTVEVSFEVPLETLSKGDFVIFEELYLEDKLVAEHKDIDDQEQTITMIEIKLEKRDKKTKETLEGVSFTLFDENGEKIKTLETDKDGLVSFLVPKGKYSVKETKTLDGYVLLQKELKFKVKGTEKEYQIYKVIDNKRIPELPKTGVGFGTLEIAVIMVSSGIILSIYLYLKQKEENGNV